MNGLFRGTVHGSVTVGDRGQIVIPSEIRSQLGIRPGDRLIVMVKPERKIVGLMRAHDFNVFLRQASRMIATMGKKIGKKAR